MKELKSPVGIHERLLISFDFILSGTYKPRRDIKV